MKIGSFRFLLLVGLLTVSGITGAQTVTIAVPASKSNSSVKISADKALLSTNTSSPFTGEFTNSIAGTHSLTTAATDGGSATTTSAASMTMNAAAIGPVSATRSYVYDQFDRLCKSINPESGATVIDYDAASNIVWTAEGTTLTGPTCDRTSVPEAAKAYRTYDKMNRLTSITTPTGQANFTQTYTPDGLVATSATNSSDNILVTNTYVYNKRRLLESETVSQAGWYTWSVAYGYDANGHQSTLTYPNGLSVAYAPNALGQATQVSGFASSISYYPNGAIQRFTYGNGIVHTLTPNLRGLPARSQDMNGSAAVLDDNYSFDANGNVSTIIDQAQGTTRGMYYDGLDRLTTASSTPSAAMWGDAHYSYDALDNLRSSSLGMSGYTYDYDANNRLATLGRTGGGAYTYLTDPRGNITNDGLRTYTWDFLNRMYAVDGKEYYRYDGQGRRVLSWRPTGPPGEITLFMYSQSGQVLYVEDGLHGQSTDNIYLGNSLLATRSQSHTTGTVSFRYQHTDALGSPVAVTDSTAQVVERTIYAPYGAPVNRPVEGVGYTGHVMDQTTGLIYMQQRYYDPQIGRFLSVDPARAAFNLYSYAGNNPYRFTDPDGRAPQGCQRSKDGCGNKPPPPPPPACNQACMRLRHTSDWGGTKGALLGPMVAGPATTTPAPPTGTPAPVRVAGWAAIIAAIASIPGDSHREADEEQRKKTIVIGEDMAGRVIPLAASIGAEFYNPPPMASSEYLAANIRWINEKMNERYLILDVGAAPGRPNYPNPSSPYYAAELRQIEQRSYQAYVPLYGPPD